MKPSNVLHIPSRDEGWCDKDVLMVHACFTLFEKFVDEEWGGLGSKKASLNRLSESSDEHVIIYTKRMRKVLKKAYELYHWWQKRKVTTRNEIDEDVFEEDTRMLMKLLSIRGYLWT